MDHTDVEAQAGTCEAAAEAGAAVATDAFRGSLTVETKSDPMDSVSEVDRAAQRAVVAEIRERSAAPIVAEEDLDGVDTLSSLPEAGPAWVVDPIDGTNNYVAGNRNWGVAVACVTDAAALRTPTDRDPDATPVVAVNEMPALGDTYRLADGTTRNGEAVTTSARTDTARFGVNPIFATAAVDRERLPPVVETVMSEFGDLRRYGCAQLVLSCVAAGELDAAVSRVGLNPWDVVGGVEMVRAAGGEVTTAAGEPWTPSATSLVATNGEAHEAVVAAFDP
ncbi:MAG: inositol monophosphatase [Halolamina sp.]